MLTCLGNNINELSQLPYNCQEILVFFPPIFQFLFSFFAYQLASLSGIMPDTVILMIV